MQKEELQKKTDQKDSDDDDQANQDPSYAKLTKGQKKKLKQKKKKDQQKAAQSTKPQQKKLQQAEGKQQKTEQTKAQQKKQQKQKKGDKNKKGGKVNAAALLAKKKQQQQQKFQQEQQRKIRQYQAQQERIRLEQQARKKKQLDQRLQRQRIQKESIAILKSKGIYESKKQKQKNDRIRQQMKNQKDGVFNLDEEKQKTEEELQADKERAQKKIKKEQHNSVLKDDRIYFQLKEGEYRSPVCAILGHVDTGKTTLLDKIRKTNVQQGQAGGITQQIGATFFPHQKLKYQVSKCSEFLQVDVNVPGLLIIDTPGHESFSNLRSRGSSLCDIAILVIDLQHGLQNQTLQSLELLKKRNTPFVVALNKIDRSYGWQSVNDRPSYEALKKQNPQTLYDYQSKLKKVMLQLNEKGYNAALYWQNTDLDDYISLVPTSGITGQGIPDILSLLVKYSLTIPSIQKRIKVKKDKFNCTVMQVKMLEGYGTTIDCILVDGKIKKQDQIVLLGFNGPIVTKVKAILTPHPMKQMRIKDEYLHHKQIHAANGVKLSATGLDQAVAGTPLFVANTYQQIQEAKAICLNEFQNIKKKIKLQNLGVGVAASTLGSLQALLQYLAKQKVPVSYITVGPVSKDDVMKAMKSVLSQIPQKRKKEFCCLLVFDVKVLHDAQKYAQQNHIKIFTANIIYHLTDFFTKFVEQIRIQRREKQGKDAIFPCVLKQVMTFRKNDPVVLGVDVQYGVLKIGTPITVYRKKQKGDKQVRIGFVESIEHNHKKIKQARRATGSVAISIAGEPKVQAGKDFDQKERLVSIISRKSIDCLKEHYRNDVSKDQWELVVELKKYFNIN